MPGEAGLQEFLIDTFRAGANSGDGSPVPAGAGRFDLSSCPSKSCHPSLARGGSWTAGQSEISGCLQCSWNDLWW